MKIRCQVVRVAVNTATFIMEVPDHDPLDDRWKRMRENFSLANAKAIELADELEWTKIEDSDFRWHHGTESSIGVKAYNYVSDERS